MMKSDSDPNSAAMIVALGPVLDTPPAERPQLWAGAAAVMVAASVAAWYLRRCLPPTV